MKDLFKILFYIMFFPLIICWWIFKVVVKGIFICLGVADLSYKDNVIVCLLNNMKLQKKYY